MLWLVNASIVDCDEEGGHEWQLEEYPMLKESSKAVAINPSLLSENKEQLLSLIVTTDVLELDIKRWVINQFTSNIVKYRFLWKRLSTKRWIICYKRTLLNTQILLIIPRSSLFLRKTGQNVSVSTLGCTIIRLFFDSESMHDAYEIFPKLAGHR